MGQAIGGLLAVGVALSPIPIIAVVLMACWCSWSPCGSSAG
jgi:hypothetical protein